MKLLIVGNDTQWAIERFYCNHLNSLGITTSIYDVNRYYKLNSYLFKIRFKLLDASIFKKLNKDLISYCKQTKFKFVWIFKGIEIFPKTLQILKKLGIILINYNPDHPFIRYSPSHGGSNIPKSLPLYDIIFSYREDLVYNIKKKYGIQTCRLPFGYEPSLSKGINFERTKCKNNLSFIGIVDKSRAEILKFIANNGFKIDLYSNQFYSKKIIYHKNIKINSAVYGKEFWKSILKHRIQLNLLRKHNLGSHNQRTFEVPGVGGILLSDYSKEQKDFFVANEEAFFFNKENLLNQIDNILSLSKKNAETIRKNAKSKSENNGYSYMSRTKIVYNQLINFS